MHLFSCMREFHNFIGPAMYMKRHTPDLHYTSALCKCHWSASRGPISLSWGISVQLSQPVHFSDICVASMHWPIEPEHLFTSTGLRGTFVFIATTITSHKWINSTMSFRSQTVIACGSMELFWISSGHGALARCLENHLKGLMSF